MSNLQPEQLPLRLPQRRLHLACRHTRHHPGRQHFRLFTRDSLTSVSLGICCLQLQRPHLTLGRSHCTRALRSDAAVGKERVGWEMHSSGWQRSAPCPCIMRGTVESNSQLPQLLRKFRRLHLFCSVRVTRSLNCGCDAACMNLLAISRPWRHTMRLQHLSSPAPPAAPIPSATASAAAPAARVLHRTHTA